MQQRRTIAGFTLIELLATIGIIAILSAIVYASFGRGNVAARDAERQAELRLLETAIQQYKRDKGFYPPMGVDSNNDGYSSETETPNYILGLTPTYINRLPTDPRRTGTALGFSYRMVPGNTASGTVFKVATIGTVEGGQVTFRHPMRFCDIRVQTNDSDIMSTNVVNLTVNGLCSPATSSSNPVTGVQPPSWCRPSQAPFNNSFALWSGFAQATTDTISTICR